MSEYLFRAHPSFSSPDGDCLGLRAMLCNANVSKLGRPALRQENVETADTSYREIAFMYM